MDWWLLTFFTGAILSLFLPIVPDFSYVIFFTVISLLLFCLAHVCSFAKQWFKYALKYVAVFTLAFAWMCYQGANYNTDKQLITEMLNTSKTLVAEGQITTLVNNLKAKDSVRFNFLIHSIAEQRLATPMNVRLSWQKPPQPLAQDQTWRIAIRLKPAYGLANTGGFHYQAWLRGNSLVASGYVKTTAEQPGDCLSVSTSLRQRWFDQISQNVYQQEYGGLYLALTFGVRDFLTSTDWQVLQATGTQHLIAISGLHIGLVAGASFYFLLMLIRVLPLTYFPSIIKQTLLMQNGYYLAIVGSLSCAGFYSYLAGFSAPTMRALIMLLLFWLAKCLAIKLSKTRLLLLTACLVLMIDPMSILSAGFWLSFYAVSVIFFSYWLSQHLMSRRHKGLRYLQSLLLVQFALSAFILPVAAILQFNLPLMAIAANIFAVPFMSVICLPVTLLSVLNLLIGDYFSVLLDIAWLCFDILWGWLEFISRIQWAYISLGWHSIVFLIMILALCCIGFLMRSARLLVVLLFAFSLRMVHLSHVDQPQTQWQVNVLDVGQGLSVVIQKGSHAILYDTGASYPSGFAMVEAVVVPFLKSQGVNQLDKVFISHSDNDHAGGLTWLKQHFVIQKVISNDVAHRADNVCIKGQQYIWQGLTIKVLSPTADYLTLQQAPGHENDDSCVLMISDNTYQVLLTGDISKRVEQQLIVQHQAKRNSLNATVLIAPHHGSNTSSSAEFIDMVAPKYTVFSAGYLNRWQMPTKAVVARYQAQNKSVYNTAESGLITIKFTHKSSGIKQYRLDQYPFWFAN